MDLSPSALLEVGFQHHWTFVYMLTCHVAGRDGAQTKGIYRDGKLRMMTAGLILYSMFETWLSTIQASSDIVNEIKCRLHAMADSIPEQVTPCLTNV